MKFDPYTMAILKNFSTINQSIVFVPGSVIATLSPSKSIMARAEVPIEIPSMFGIYDLPKFIATMSLFSEPILEIRDKFAIVSQADRKINYTFTEPSFILTPPNRPLVLNNNDVSFDITAEQLQEALKALAILSLPDIVFEGDGSEILMKAKNTSDTSDNTFSCVVGTTDRVFSVIFKAENLKIIPGDYHVDISEQGITQWTGKQVTYWITFDSTTSFGKK